MHKTLRTSACAERLARKLRILFLKSLVWPAWKEKPSLPATKWTLLTDTPSAGTSKYVTVKLLNLLIAAVSTLSGFIKIAQDYGVEWKSNNQFTTFKNSLFVVSQKNVFALQKHSNRKTISFARTGGSQSWECLTTRKSSECNSYILLSYNDC